MTERYRSVKQKVRDLVPLGVILGGFLGCGGAFVGVNALDASMQKRAQEAAKENLHLVFDVEAETNPWCVQARLAGNDVASGELELNRYEGGRGNGAHLGEREFYTLGYGAFGMKDHADARLTAFAGGVFDYRGDHYTVTPKHETGQYGVTEFDGLAVERTCNNVEIIFK